jgi:tRNA modification GTPase
VYLAETIVAIATAISPAQGSIAIVRVSGSLAQTIARRLFVPKGKQVWESHRILYGFIHNPATGEIVDEALLLLMFAPRSYTREDMIEFHCHGGIISVQKVLELCLAQGARLAMAGEFTTRAFLNGRIDLTQAEAIQDLISAQSPQSAQIALSQLEGRLKNDINELRKECIDILATIEAHIDFADDLPTLDPHPIHRQIHHLLARCRAILSTSTEGELLRESTKVAIIGRPNVGKSSLLNAWSKTDKAIVTDLPGTTRDIVESHLVVKGIPVQILDTAGIRQTDQLVEEIGIQRSLQAAQKADIILLVIDTITGWQTHDRDIYELVKDKPILLVINKTDLASEHIKLPELDIKTVATSAINNQGISDLETAILELIGANNLDLSQSKYAINQRHKSCLVRAIADLENLENTIHAQLPLDFWTIDLRQAIHALGEITGESITENLLDQIFSRFCLGK